MLYPTLNQPLIIVMMLLAGFACGIVFDVCRILTLLSGNDKVSKHIFDFIATLISCAVLYLNNLHFNYGRFRLYVIALFLISFALERKLVQKLWTKLLQKWYSSIVQRREEWKNKKNKN
ncbi:MAG: spore cortex biosynthesis protein YabQ [Clostridia bacterium]|nr:spore cortex biosynthesis protein YabQ [Clostridia bacterium]